MGTKTKPGQFDCSAGEADGSAASRSVGDMKMSAAFAGMTTLYRTMRDNADEIARTRKAMFDAYVRAGFDEGRALELVKGSLLP